MKLGTILLRFSHGALFLSHVTVAKAFGAHAPKGVIATVAEGSGLDTGTAVAFTRVGILQERINAIEVQS